MGIIKQKKTNKNLITCFLDEIKNIEIRKKSAYELFNCKKKKKNDDNNNTNIDLSEKSINDNPKNDLIKNSSSNNQNHSNSNPLTLIKDNILALFPCGPHMPIFDEIDNIIRVFHSKFNKVDKEIILSVLNATSFDLEQACYDLNNYCISKPMIYSFTNSEDYIIQHMRNSSEFKELIKKKGINSVIRRIQYFQKNY